MIPEDPKNLSYNVLCERFTNQRVYLLEQAGKIKQLKAQMSLQRVQLHSYEARLNTLNAHEVARDKKTASIAMMRRKFAATDPESMAVYASKTAGRIRKIENVTAELAGKVATLAGKVDDGVEACSGALGVVSTVVDLQARVSRLERPLPKEVYDVESWGAQPTPKEAESAAMGGAEDEH